jgi:signal transduction histidine kinase/ligand-binding sensor domain-containing protein/CheY-like chemotaxis protein
MMKLILANSIFYAQLTILPQRIKINFICKLLLCIFFFSQQASAFFTEIESPFNSKIIKIQQDSLGFVWIATEFSMHRFDGYQFEPLILDNIDGDVSTKISDFLITDNDLIYIATANNGLLEYSIKTQANPVKSLLINDVTIQSIFQIDSVLWVATNKALYLIENNTPKEFVYPDNSIPINKIIKTKDNQILLLSQYQLYQFDSDDLTFEQIDFDGESIEKKYIWDLVQNKQSDILLATEAGLYIGNSELTDWYLMEDNPDYIVRSIAVTDDRIWLGTIKNGLMAYQSKFKEINHEYELFDTANSDLQNNEINHLFEDLHGNLWIGFYNGKINILSKNAWAFGHNQGIRNNPKCLESAKYVYHINQDQQQNIWLTTQDGFIKIDAHKRGCFIVSLQSTKELSQSAIPLFTFETGDGYIWGYLFKQGFIKLSKDQQPRIIESLTLSQADLALYQYIHKQGTNWVFATSSGVMEFDPNELTLSPVKVADTEIAEAIIKDVSKATNNQYFLATSRGLAIYDANESLVFPSNEINEQLTNRKLNTIHLDSQNNIWLGTTGSGLYKFNHKKLVKQYKKFDQNLTYKKISNIVEDKNQNLWLTTENGLIKLSINTDKINVFGPSQGLQGANFNTGAAFKSKDNKIYLGGLNGFNAFTPEEITIESTPQLTLHELKRFNQKILPNLDYEGFQIRKNFAYLDEITLTHNDYVVSFGFTDFNFVDPNSSQFAYQLVGFDPDWNYVQSENRMATYTNLPSRDYIFRVNSTDQFGQWNTEYKSIAIKVKPAPWLTWWALSFYVFLILLAIYGYVQWKIKSNKKIADRLRIDVAEKTQELQIQKQTIESLLNKKNELFSNVSHEFRTPLTLILGPIKELIRTNDKEHNLKSLQLINRNANRLLSLVEQLLQIARVSDFKSVKTHSQKTQSQIQSLIDSFQHFAGSKKVQLKLVRNDESIIDVTDQFIDAVLGNLVSNAIKYNHPGGLVEVSSVVSGDEVSFVVKDTGIGLTEQQQKDIFKRFKRLDSHQGIEGIGIGLSVVEEVVKVNDGQIKVESEPGKGSQFTVTLTLSEQEEGKEIVKMGTLVQQLQAEIEQTVIEISSEETVDDTRYDILVIEDNLDMREHIIEILTPFYNVRKAENGRAGVAKAIEQIPDLIISDVMMPEMDGYQVARIIRSDQRTSHIPLMLLTALNDKTSRIKGWKEHVDAYMTKPFDRDELLIQLENMLTIRDILKKQAGKALNSADSLPSILPKKDQAFIDKLMKVIEDNYQDPLLNRSIIASKMAVSDRQLQRKLKALVDQNPMDLLREFRLNKSKELLQDGYQVSQIADDCGFNSLSYFSQCFKLYFGVSPKQYQQAGK